MFASAFNLRPQFLLPTIAVGAAIKDLPDDADTHMKQIHTAAVHRAEQQFAADNAQYNIDFQKATQKAETASKEIQEARNENAYAITSLVLSILGIVGVAIAVAATGTITFGFIAIPFALVLIPAICFSCSTANRVYQLDKDMRAPGELPKPRLKRPIYRIKNDLDLKSSRIEVQEELATASLRSIVNSRWDQTELVKYALLDRVAPMEEKKRPIFYAACVELIQAYTQIIKERESLRAQTNREFDHMEEERRDWRDMSRQHADSQWSNLWAKEQHYNRKKHEFGGGYYKPTAGEVADMRHLQGQWTAHEHATVRSKARNRDWEWQNRRWLESSLAQIEHAYGQAQAHLEQKYVAAKLRVS